MALPRLLTTSDVEPATTVVAETSYGQSSAVGVATNYAREDHTHGTPALGTTGTTACAGNDARLSDARTPTTHTHSLWDITDEGALAALNTVGTAQIDAGAVTYAKIQDVSAASRLLGRGSAAGSGDTEEITLGTNLSMSGTTLNATGGGLSDGDKGDITVGGGGTTLTIDAGAVTFAKMQGIAAAKLVGRTAEGIGLGDMQEITLGTNLSMSGTTLNATGGSGGGPDWFF